VAARSVSKCVRHRRVHSTRRSRAARALTTQHRPQPTTAGTPSGANSGNRSDKMHPQAVASRSPWTTALDKRRDVMRQPDLSP
jgi:hypothetical protein